MDRRVAFAACRRVAGPRCTLYTYSASTATRVALLLAGWAVGVGEAIGSKAQTTAAAIHVADLQRPLDQRWLPRVARSDAPLPPDAPPDVVQRIAAASQFSGSRCQVSDGATPTAGRNPARRDGHSADSCAEDLLGGSE